MLTNCRENERTVRVLTLFLTLFLTLHGYNESNWDNIFHLITWKKMSREQSFPMDHRNGKKAIAIPAYTSEWEGGLPLFFLIGLLPVDEALSVNTDCLVVSLVLTNSTSGNPILRQRLLTESQMRLLLTLLQSPHYCPHEVLYAGLFCSFQGLLAGLFSSEHIAREEWLTAIRETGLRLEHAEAQGMLRKELKQLYNSLEELHAAYRASSGVHLAAERTLKVT